MNAVAEFTKSYRDLISGSHGISRKYLEKMLSPIGVDLAPLNLDIEKLGTLAAARGSSAHLSPFSTKLQDAPSKVANDAVAAAKAAENVNLAISALEAKIRTNLATQKQRPGFFQRLFAH